MPQVEQDSYGRGKRNDVEDELKCRHFPPSLQIMSSPPTMLIPPVLMHKIRIADSMLISQPLHAKRSTGWLHLLRRDATPSCSAGSCMLC